MPDELDASSERRRERYHEPQSRRRLAAVDNNEIRRRRVSALSAPERLSGRHDAGAEIGFEISPERPQSPERRCHVVRVSERGNTAVSGERGADHRAVRLTL